MPAERKPATGLRSAPVLRHGASFVSERSGVETALYRPVKKFLERLGYEVKGEIGECDLVALRDGIPPVVVIGELKLSFNLDLVLQGVDRTASCDEVWLAVRASSR